MPDTPPVQNLPTPQNNDDGGMEGEPLTAKDIPGSNSNVLKSLIGEPSKAPQEPTPEPEPKPADPPPTEPKPDVSKKDEPVMPPAELFETPKPVDGDDDFDPNSIDVDQVPEPMRPNFAKMRDKLNGLTKDIETMRAERDALQERIKSGESADPETLKLMKEEQEKLLDTIGQMNLERDPRFIAKYEAQRQPITESLKTMLKSYDVENMDVDGVIGFAANLGPADRMQFLQSQMPEEIQNAALGVLLPMFAQYDVVENARKAELQNHAKILAEMSDKQKEADAASLNALRDDVKKSAIEKLSKEEMLLKKIDGNEAWNKTVDGLMQSIETVFTEQAPQVHAEALIMSRLAPMYKMFFLAERQRAASYEAALKARNIAVPGIDNKSPKSGETPVKGGAISADDAAARVTAKFMG